MAISKVKYVNIIGLAAYLDRVVDVCCAEDYFHPDSSETNESVQAFSDGNPYEESLNILNKITASLNIPTDRLTGTDQAHLPTDINHYIKELDEDFGTLAAEKDRLQKQIEQNNNDLSVLSHFVGCDLDLGEIFASRFIKVRFGRIPNQSFIKLKSYDSNPYVLFFPCQEDEYYHYGVYFSPPDTVSEIDRIFANLYFERITVPYATGTPEEKSEQMKQDNKLLSEQLKQVEIQLKDMWQKEQKSFCAVYDYIRHHYTNHKLRRCAAKYKEYFILSGFIEEKHETLFAQQMDQVEGIEYTIEQPLKEMDPPIALKNNRFSKPFEMFVEMFGLPSYNEIDPTLFVSITFTIMFGIMFGDVGQGLVLSLVGYFMWRIKKSDLGRILIRCGMSAAFFGVVFGSVFGYEHLLDPFYQRVFGWEGKPIEVMAPENTMTILGVSIGFGVILICFAMLFNIAASLKRKDFESALFSSNGVAGLIFYPSLIAGIGGALFFGFNLFSLPFVLIALILPLLFMFFKHPLGRLVAGKKKLLEDSLSDFIIENFFEVFESILSYISNTLSFMRIGVFVLLHAGLMMVIFSLADAAGGAAPIVIVLGNAIVMGLEALLVTIQVIRLEFYEIFSRFYIGGGRSFVPASVEVTD